jgi:hypothetical protein
VTAGVKEERPPISWFSKQQKKEKHMKEQIMKDVYSSNASSLG